MTKKFLLAALLVATSGIAFAGDIATPKRFASTLATARVEYWQTRQLEIAKALSDRDALRNLKLVFLGDSITDFWLMGDDLWVPGQRHGRLIWQESFAGQPKENWAINLGISGDRTEHVLHRILTVSQGGLGELDAPELQPEFIVVMLGINNSWAPEEPAVDSIFEGVRAVLMAVHERKPRAKIVVQAVLPTNDPEKNRNVVRPVNKRLAELVAGSDFSRFTAFLDLYPAYVDAAGEQIARLFVRDGLHPSEDGYRVWRDKLTPFLATQRNRLR
jgi:lysophospholipase L1-like esterase